MRLDDWRGTTSRSRRVFATIAVAALLGTAAFAHAAAETATQKAKALFENGVTDYNLGHYAEALVSFEQAYRVRHDPAFLYNIGQCHRQLRHYEDAARSFRAYLRETADIPETTRQQLLKLIGDMEKSAEGARGNQPSAARTPEAPTGSRESGQHTESSARPAAAPVSPSGSSSTERAGRMKTIAGVAVASFGVVAIGAGAGFFAVANSANDQVNHPSNGVYSQSAEDKRDTFQSLDIAAFVVGAVAIATGATIALFGWSQRHHVTVAPLAAARRLGVVANVAF